MQWHSVFVFHAQMNKISKSLSGFFGDKNHTIEWLTCFVCPLLSCKWSFVMSTWLDFWWLTDPSSSSSSLIGAKYEKGEEFSLFLFLPHLSLLVSSIIGERMKKGKDFSQSLPPSLSLIPLLPLFLLVSFCWIFTQLNMK